MKKVVIIGAGFAGGTVARLLADKGYEVEIYEEREHVGGNAYDFVDESKSYVHLYGPHIFHTNIQEVYEFLSNYTDWFPYEHKVLGYIDGNFVPIPFSLKSLEMNFPKDKAAKLKKLMIEKYGDGNKVPISKLREEKDKELGELADYVYNKVFLNYTKKQWDMLPEELGDGVTGRVPVYVSYDERYFQDKYQFMPAKGYTELFNNMLNHPNIKITTNKKINDELSFEKDKILFNNEEVILIYTGMIDELFNYKYGELEYRSLDFEFETLNKKSFQGAAVVNYPNDNKFTRITEFKKFTVENCKSNKTTIVREYPCKYEKGKIPYYPIPLQRCEDNYKKYFDESKKYKNLYLIGRLAEYKYYNMDLVIKSAMDLAEKIVSGGNK